MLDHLLANNWVPYVIFMMFLFWGFACLVLLEGFNTMYSKMHFWARLVISGVYTWMIMRGLDQSATNKQGEFNYETWVLWYLIHVAFIFACTVIYRQYKMKKSTPRAPQA